MPGTGKKGRKNGNGCNKTNRAAYPQAADKILFQFLQKTTIAFYKFFIPLSVKTGSDTQ
jgi:hypothetical protein